MLEILTLQLRYAHKLGKPFALISSVVEVVEEKSANVSCASVSVSESREKGRCIERGLEKEGRTRIESSRVKRLGHPRDRQSR